MYIHTIYNCTKKKRKEMKRFSDDCIAWLLFRRSSLQQLGHVITCISDIKNKRRATAAARLALSRRVYIAWAVLAHLALGSQEGSCHIFQRVLRVHVNAGNVWRVSVKKRVFPWLEEEKRNSWTFKPPPWNTWNLFILKYLLLISWLLLYFIPLRSLCVSLTS